MTTIQKKIIVVGDSSVGKTSVIHRYVKGEFDSTIIATIGIDYRAKDVEINGQKIKLQIWDTIGQEKYRSLAPQYFRRADGVILFYDTTVKTSFTHLQNWLDSIINNAQSSIPVILVGNKVDLPEVVPKEHAIDFARDKKLELFFCSAKSGDNIDQIFNRIAELTLQHTVEQDQPQNVVTVKETTPEDKKNGCHC